MRTSELAGQAGVNTETLRNYERRGLLTSPPPGNGTVFTCQEPPRTLGGYRDHPPSTVEMTRFIKRAQELGFTHDEVEELLHLDNGGRDACDAARVLAEHCRADPEARIRDLQRMHDSLADLVATCDLPGRHAAGVRCFDRELPARDSDGEAACPQSRVPVAVNDRVGRVCGGGDHREDNEKGCFVLHPA